MAYALETTRNQTEASPQLAQVIQFHRTNRVRQEIGYIADRSFREGIINKEAHEGYREVAESREKFKLDEKMLTKIRQDAQDYEARAIRIYQRIEEGRQAGFVSESDEEHLMGAWVVNNINFLKTAPEVEARIQSKIGRLERDKKRYEKIISHRLVEAGENLKLNASDKLSIPDEDEYKEMTPLERRTFFEKFDKAIKQAEKHAELEEDEARNKRLMNYKGKLFTARQNKIIGKVTFNKFLDGFEALKNKEEEEYWLEEFNAQMERYETLQKQIGSTLQGDALKKMQNNLDKMGYSQLMMEFGGVQQAEVQRLNQLYAEALYDYQKKGIIGEHTANEFNVWMERQMLPGKYDALEKLPSEMQRYENLDGQINQLTRSQKNYLHSHRDEWGYTEMKAEYERIKNGETTPAHQVKSKAQNILDQVRDARAKEAIVEAEEILEEEGGVNRKRDFASTLKRLFSGQNREKFDATKFEDQVRMRVLENKEQLEEEARYKNETEISESNPLYNYVIDDEDDDVEDEIDILEASDESEVTERSGMIQVETYNDDDGKTHREAEFLLNTKNGLNEFMAEDREHHFQSEASGGRDDVSLAFYAKNQKIEMDYATIQNAADYLHLKAEAANDGDYEEDEERAAS